MKKGLIQIGLFFWFGVFSNHFKLLAQTDSLGTNKQLPSVDVNYIFRLNRFAGFLIPHHEDMQHMYREINGFQLQVLHDLASVNDSHPSNKHLGYSLAYYDLGSNVNGKAFASALLIEADLFKFNNAQKEIFVKSSFQFGLGLGYLTERFDFKTNPYNRAIGSHINGYMQLGLLLEGRIKQGLGYHFSLGISHFSNASWKYPNLGVNLPYIKYGMNVQIAAKKQLSQLKNNFSTIPVSAWRKSIALRMGKKEVDLDDNRAFYNGLLEFSFEKYRNASSNFRFSAGLYHDRTYQYKKFETLPNYDVLKCTELTLSVGYETRFGRWGVMTDLGVYAYKPDFKKKTPYYEAIGLSYQINPSYRAVMRLKANKTTADFAEFGLTYLINE